MSAERSRRVKKGRTDGVVPSASHYVGYCLDDETPEMIMKKFEAMERIVAERQLENNGDGVMMDEDTLKEVFKNTSNFNVINTQNDYALMGEDDLVEDELEDMNEGEEGMHWRSEGLDLGFEFAKKASKKEAENAAAALPGEKKKGRPKREGGEPKPPKEPKEPKAPKQQAPPARPQQPNALVIRPGANQKFITTYNPETNAFIRKPVKEEVDRIVRMHIPNPPLPTSWGPTLRPYVPEHVTQAVLRNPELCTYKEVPQLKRESFTGFKDNYLAILINSGWQHDLSTGAARNAAGPSTDRAQGEPSAAPVCIDRLREIPFKELCPNGFIFIWAEKREIQQIWRLMRAEGYNYVENQTWLIFEGSHRVAMDKAEYFARSHRTLLIFRRDNLETKKIELRHQRTSDVVYDYVRRVGGRPWAVPEESYVAIETLLPEGAHRFLELWAAKDVGRKGWHHMVELKTLEDESEWA